MQLYYDFLEVVYEFSHENYLLVVLVIVGIGGIVLLSPIWLAWAARDKPADKMPRYYAGRVREMPKPPEKTEAWRFGQVEEAFNKKAPKFQEVKRGKP